ncbi:MAG: hypothetical protein SFT68_00175 [Rickettsiaceae bacterium]|nr:hypothetical protein [Rickettsiaceae bacterium]
MKIRKDNIKHRQDFQIDNGDVIVISLIITMFGNSPLGNMLVKNWGLNPCENSILKNGSQNSLEQNIVEMVALNSESNIDFIKTEDYNEPINQKDDDYVIVDDVIPLVGIN